MRGGTAIVTDPAGHACVWNILAAVQLALTCHGVTDVLSVAPLLVTKSSERVSTLGNKK